MAAGFAVFPCVAPARWLNTLFLWVADESWLRSQTFFGMHFVRGSRNLLLGCIPFVAAGFAYIGGVTTDSWLSAPVLGSAVGVWLPGSQSFHGLHLHAGCRAHNFVGLQIS